MGATVQFDPGTKVFAALKADDTSEEDADNIADMVADAGFEVGAVNWVFEQVTGESLIEKCIMPITGDFNKIGHDGDAWRKVSDAMGEFADTMRDNDHILSQHWAGAGATAHTVYVDVGWKAGLIVEGKIAETIGKGFDKIADVSKKLCKEALKLLKKLVDKCIEAAAEIWVPLAGWAAAAEKVWAAYQIYRMVLDIIEQVKDIIAAVQQIFADCKAIGSQLAKIKDIRSVSDAIDVGANIADSAGDIKKQGGDIKDSTGNIVDDGHGIYTSARDAGDRAHDWNQKGTEAQAHKDEQARRDQFDEDHRQRAADGQTQPGELSQEQQRRRDEDARQQQVHDDYEAQKKRRETRQKIEDHVYKHVHKKVFD